MPENNEKQNISIAEIKIEIKNFKERLDKFIDNEFAHLRERVDWILWIFILGTLITITITLLR